MCENKIIALKSSLKSFNSRLHQVEEKNKQLKDKSFELIELEEEKEKSEEKWSSLRDFQEWESQKENTEIKGQREITWRYNGWELTNLWKETGHKNSRSSMYSN